MVRLLALSLAVSLAALSNAHAAEAKAPEKKGPESEKHALDAKPPAAAPKGKELELKTASGKAFKVYESSPGAPSDAPAVIVIHEWWGLNDHVRSNADRVAGLGLRAFAIDLYDGKVAGSPEEAGKMMKAVDPKEASAKLDALYKHLGSAKKVGTIGWCFGGGWSMKTSLAHPEKTAATVVYYGEVGDDVAALKKLAKNGAVLGIFANKDGWISPAMVDKFETAAKKAGLKTEVHRYDADHAFANPSNPHHDDKSAADAWSKTERFLKERLQ